MTLAFDFYREAPAALPMRLSQWRDVLCAASLVTSIDPWLLAAIMDRETNGKNILGDGGHGHGLMQIDDRSHASFLEAVQDNGVHLWKNPSFNVLYGAHLLARNLASFGGETWPAVAAYNAGPGNVRRALAKLQLSKPTHSFPDRLAACDSVTHGGNYASDVMRRRDAFLARRNSLVS